jgi:integrase
MYNVSRFFLVASVLSLVPEWDEAVGCPDVFLKETEMSMYEEKVGDLIKSADAVVDRHANLRVNGKVSSLRTQEYSKQVVRETCRRLHKLGYYLQDIAGLSEKHIRAIVESWHSEGKSPKTMQNQYSRLKIFCGWLGKPGIIDRSGVGVAAYLPGVDVATLKVSTIAEKSRSWTGNGVDVIDVLRRATLEDQRFGSMLTLGIAFGLRKKEMLRINLWSSDKGRSLDIDGSVGKNGKYRAIFLEDGEYGQFQRWALDQTKGRCKKRETLGWPGLTFKQAENRFYHYCKRIGLTKAELGVTTHCGRAEFFENIALLRGLVPPTLGGTVDQMSKDKREAIGIEVSQLGGHEDIHTVRSYYGSFRKVAKTDGIGGQVGPVIAVDIEKEIFVSLWVNPKPIAGNDGKYRVQSQAELSQTTVTAVLAIPWEKERHVPIATFVEENPGLAEKIRQTLGRVGFVPQ